MRNKPQHYYCYAILLSVILVSGCRTKILEIENDTFKVEGHLRVGPVTTHDVVIVTLISKSDQFGCDGEIIFSEEIDSLKGYFLNDNLFLLKNGFHWLHKMPEDYHILNFLKSDCKRIEFTNDYITLDPDTLPFLELRASHLDEISHESNSRDSYRIKFCKSSIRGDMFLIRIDSESSSDFLTRRIYIPYAEKVSGKIVNDRFVQADIKWIDGQVVNSLLVELPKAKSDSLVIKLTVK